MHGFRIDRVFGIDIRVDLSWLFIVVLLTWNLSAVFSGWHHGWPLAASTGLALTASLLFFGCLLLHELAHSAVAARFGMRVRSITLFLFGGVSDIEREPPSPKAEFLMEIAAPISSILLGLVFLFAASLTTGFSLSDERTAWTELERMGALETLLVWLGTMNLVIGAFNLMPAFPLDDDALVGVVSIADVRGVPPTEWGATTVAAVMQPLTSVPTATPGEPLADAFQELARRDVDQLPVLEDGRLVGVLQRRDVTRWLELAWGPLDGPGRRSSAGARTASTAMSMPSRGNGDPHPRSI